MTTAIRSLTLFALPAATRVAAIYATAGAVHALASVLAPLLGGLLARARRALRRLAVPHCHVER